MSDKKNQHFVPQCYLRNFSEDRKSIAVFLKSEKRIISNASIKNQCSKPFIYGKDLLIENALQGPEQKYSGVARSVIENEYCSDDDLNFLLFFLDATEPAGRALTSGPQGN